MARYKIIYLLLLTYIVSAKEAEDRTISLKPPDKLILQKSSPYSKEQPTFFSKLKNWFFPASDPVPAEGHHGGPQYLPPQPYQRDTGCNSCNQAPWIPVASNVGHNTVINFVPPSSHIEDLRPPTDQYGPPPSTNYGPPPSQHGPPVPEYGPPPSQHGPPSPEYGPPPSQHGPPSPEYGPPPSQHGPPSPEYGPPSSQHGPPSQEYGPPPSQYAPRPSQEYGPPSSQYGPPPIPSSQYGSPPSPEHSAPPISSQYGPPPSPEYGAPSLQHGPPPPSHHAPPSSHYNLDLRPPPPPSSHRRPIFRPRPNKLLSIQNLKPPPPVTHLRPVSQNYIAIGMKPPPLTGSYHSLPTSPSVDIYLPPPPPPPSDSYGAPVVGANADYQTRPEYLPPIEQLPLSSMPIPLPNLGPYPVAPIHNHQDFRNNVAQHPIAPIHNHQDFRDNVHQHTVAPISNHQNFRDNLPQQGAHYEVKSNSNVQLVPSVKVADFLASVEHPINVIQSPLVEVSVKPDSSVLEDSDVRPGGFYQDTSGKLSDNPIIVEDTHTAASAVNVTFQESNIQDIPKASSSYRSESDDVLNSNLIKQLLLHQEASSQNKTFTPPPLDYSKWQPTWTVSSSMVPPPMGPTTWLQPVSSTTKKPKQIQIIVPYISNKKPVPFNNVGRMVPSKPYTTLLPVYSPPSTTEEVWSKFLEDFNSAESKKITATAFTPPTTQVYNIRDLLKDTKEYYSSDKLPFDVISLQNNIDDWTQQSFSKAVRDDKVSTSSKFVPSKKIPDDFFTTAYPETTTVNFDHEQAGSSKKETKLEDDIETNFIIKETTTTESTTTEKPSWDPEKVTVSPLTKERVYIVTPQPLNLRTTPRTAWSHPPKVQTNQTVVPTPKFLVRVDPEDRNSRDRLKENPGPLTVVFSEWPHLINNLQTTTTLKPTSRHPLLGLMDLSQYTPPPNATVETISGHSRVVTVVTPAAVTEKTRNVK